jgi:hypothetical protein
VSPAVAPGATGAERLLVLASLAAPDAAERSELRDLSHKVDDWPAFLDLAKLNATVPLVQRRLEGEGLFDLLPPPVQDGFQAVTNEIAGANDRRLAGAVEVLRRFDAAGIVCVVLKGMLFAVEIYDDPRYKRMNDIDILVRIDQVEEAMAIYRDLDMFSVAELFGEEPKVRPKRSHHLPSFVSRDGSLIVGTHWGLITPLAPYSIDYEAIWSRVRPIDFYGVPAWAMAPEDNLHHLCIHLPYYKTGVRELADIWNLVRHQGDGLDVDLLLAEIRKAGSQNLVYHALLLTDRLVPSPAVAKVLEAVAPDVDRWYRWDAGRKTGDAHTLLRSRSTHTSTIEKAYTEFNATHDAREKFGRFVRVWSSFLAPPRDDAVKMSSLRDPGPLSLLGARLVAPYRLAKVFQRDLGRWLFPAAMVKTVVDMAAAGVRHAAGSRHPGDLAAFAAKVGMTREQLQVLADAQE